MLIICFSCDKINYYPNVTINQFISLSKKATIEAASIPYWDSCYT